MPNPWELPLPLIADRSEAPLYEALGRAVDRWEQIELTLGIMYSFFVGDPSLNSVMLYGGGRIFRERIAGLQKAADSWFINAPCQEIEGEFQRLMAAAVGFGERRNEYAHGIVSNVEGYIFWRLQLHLDNPTVEWYLVVPPLYYARKHDGGRPLFGFSSHELNRLCNRMDELDIELNHFISRLWPENWPHIE